MDRLFPVREAAKILGLSVDDLGVLRRAGRITGTIQRVRSKKGRPRYWYKQSDIDRYIAGLETSCGTPEIVVPKPPRHRRVILKGVHQFI